MITKPLKTKIATAPPPDELVSEVVTHMPACQCYKRNLSTPPTALRWPSFMLLLSAACLLWTPRVM